MDKIQVVNRSASIIQVDTEFVKQLFHVNCLVSYPITDPMLEVWARSIQELTPELTVDILKQIIDKMKTGEYDFDNRAGVQNIFKGYKKYIVELNRYKPHLSAEQNKW